MLHETNYTQARQNLAVLLDQVTETREPVALPSSSLKCIIE